jgi:hypothetical protein
MIISPFSNVLCLLLSAAFLCQGIGDEKGDVVD